MKAVMELNSHSNVKSASCFLKNYFIIHILQHKLCIFAHSAEAADMNHVPLYNVYRYITCIWVLLDVIIGQN